MKTNGHLNGKVKTQAGPVDMLPHNPEAEDAVLGALLIDRDVILSIPFLEANDFYNQANGWLFQAIKDFAKAGKATDIITMWDELERRGQINDIGGSPRLAALSGGSFNTYYAEYYAQIVKRLAILRRGIQRATAAVQSFYADDRPIEEITSQLKSDMAELERLTATGDGSTFNKTTSNDYYLDVLESRKNNKDKQKLQFPWPDLAKLMPYLDAGTLIGLVAEPGAGKTVFMENCAEYWAKRGWKVAFYHLELSSQMMFDRRTQRQTGISIKTLQSGQWVDNVWDTIFKATDEVANWPGELHYVHCPGWSAAQIVAHAQKLHEAGGLDVIVVDYFNKIAMVNRNGLNAALSREQDIEEIKIALEQNGWVGLLAAQFDKSSRNEKGFRSLGNVKETSALEDKANVGVVIRRDRDEMGNRGNTAKIAIVKCNAGQEGSMDAVFLGDKLMFAPGTKREE